MFEVIVIGAGPAGASAAIFLAKAGKKTLVIDNDKSMTKRAWIENHYGVLEISGSDLIEVGKKQLQRLGAELVIDQVEKLAKTDDGFQVETTNAQYETKQIILTTGALTTLADQLDIQTTEGTEPRIKTVFAVDKHGKTNVPGVWAAGTAAGQSVHTIITSGDGAKVAINLISELNGTRYVDHDVLKS